MTLLAGRYRLDRPIARGGMAIVHHADDEVLKRPVAIKTLVPDRAMDPTFRAALRHEAVTVAGLTHPNIARIFDYGEDHWQGVRLPFLVVEFVPGTTLGTHVRNHGPMQWRDAATVCAGVADALAAAHARRVVHHDVKPANIMLSPAGAKVIDFGVAATAGKDFLDPHRRIWGTPAYFSPEQLRGHETGPSADIYALGLVLHACLTGQRAWPGRSADEVLVARACRPVPRLADRTGLPADLTAVYQACLARSPHKRPRAAQVARALTDLAGPKPARIGSQRRRSQPIGR
jgi:serine/threonine-protein kinase